MRRAQQCYRQSRYDEAIVHYEQALALNADAPFVVFNLGLALYKAGRKTEARAAWQHVVTQTEHHRPYLAEQARIMLRQFG